MKLTAKGQLQHHFWGNYHAGIAVSFDSPESALLALPVLCSNGIGWTQGQRVPKGLVATVDSAGLEKVKEQFGRLGADVDKIDSCAKSIDYGEPFDITVEVEDPKQQQLLPG